MPVEKVDGDWVHLPPSYSWDSWRIEKCGVAKVDELKDTDRELLKQIAAAAVDRNGAWVATLPEKTSKTILKRLVRLGYIRVRTVTYAPWDNKGAGPQGYKAVDWGTPYGKNQYEILVINDVENQSNVEVV